MDEKTYKTIGSTGASSLVIGICVLAGGIAAGILFIFFHKNHLQTILLSYYSLKMFAFEVTMKFISDSFA